MSSYGHYGSMSTTPRGAEDVVAALVEGSAGDYPDLCREPEGTWPTKGITPYAVKLRHAGEEITDLVVEKNEAYGDAINKVAAIMMILFPKGIQPNQYADMLLMVRDLDKTCRLADGDPEAFSENPWKDKAGYAICGMAVRE